MNTADLAASFQKNVVECLLNNFEKAAVNSRYGKAALAGGVSANSLLRAESKKMCTRHGLSLFLPELKYCGDNAAMVAAQGYYEYLAGTRANSSLNAYATMPIDNVIF